MLLMATIDVSIAKLAKLKLQLLNQTRQRESHAISLFKPIILDPLIFACYSPSERKRRLGVNLAPIKFHIFYQVRFWYPLETNVKN